jgi:glycogen synthase
MRELPLSRRTPLRDAKRVLITTDMVGGVWHYTIELAAALKNAGLEPVIAALGNRPPPGFANLGGLSIFFFPCKLEWMQDPWEDVRRSGEWLLRLADHLKPDVIHLNGYAHGALKFQAPLLVVGHSCVYSWYKAVKGRLPSSRWQAYREAVAGGLSAASGVTAPTAAMLSELEHYYSAFRRMAPIANGRSGADFFPTFKEPFIFSAGRVWDEAKNIPALAGIARNLAWPVKVAGELCHPEGGNIRPCNVELLGSLPQAQLAERLSKAAIYALPALYEPFGLTALEAGLSGCALVLGDIASLRETWDGAALFVPPRRPDLLESVLNRLIQDEKIRLHLARRARARALTLTTEKMASGYIELYGRLLGQEEELRPSQIKSA